MLNKFLLGIILVLGSAVAIADTVTVKPDHPESYVVVKGDTLWDITGRFLNEPWLWPQVWEANPQIKDPNLIYPGDVISLQYKDGRPILAVSRGGKSGRYVKLSPEVRSYEKDNAIPAIPIDSIKQFLTRPLVVTGDEMETWPYVVSSYNEHLVSGAGNKIYIRGLPKDASPKQRYAVYRKGKPYVNPRKDKNNILGYEALYLGDAVIEKTGDPASAIVTTSNREILNGDRLAKESENDVNTSFVPTTPNHEVAGNVISVIDGVSEIGQYQVVVLDLGANEGMQVGNVLGVYQSGKIVDDAVATKIKSREKPIDCGPQEESSIVCEIASGVADKKQELDQTDLVGYLGRPNTKPEKVELPGEYAGVLMVFRTFQNVSYALVMEATAPIHIYDTVSNL